MSTQRILAAGAYVPADRLEAETVRRALGRFDAPGISQVAVPDPDEDTLTMAVEAGIRALETAPIDTETVERLAFATTTPPMDEEDPTPRLVSMLGLESGLETSVHTASTLAGCRALEAALDRSGTALVVASDVPRGAPDTAIEHAAGAGAVAFVCSDVGGHDETRVAGEGAQVLERSTVTSPYPGTRFRRRGEHDTTGLGITAYDRQAFTETVGEALGALAFDFESRPPDATAIQAPDGKRPYRAASAAGIDSASLEGCVTVHDVGDTGAASALLSLAVALENDAETIVLAGYGSGAVATAMVLENTGVTTSLDVGADDEPLRYEEALRRRGTLSSGEPDGGGAYVSIPTWRRSIPQRHRLEVGVCPDCSGLTFPPEGACDECDSLVTFTLKELSGTGTVEAVTTIEQGGAPPEFVDQQARGGAYRSAIVGFDGPGGETVSIPTQVIGALEIGDRVETRIRRLYDQEGVIRYGCKVAPVSRQ